MNYESYNFGATVTLEHTDLGYTHEDYADRVAANPKVADQVFEGLHEMAESILDRLLIADVESAQGITEEDRSVVLRSFVRTSESTPARSAHASTSPKRTASRRQR